MSVLRRGARLVALLATVVVGPLLALPHEVATAATSTTIVVSEVYGGGGNAGAPYTHDFSNTTLVSRNPTGADTDNNNADFTVAAPSPQNCADTNTCPATAPSTIAEIQGASHLSPLSGQPVSGVTGVITARRSNGFYLQDPRGAEASGWVEGASSAVFVFTSSAPAPELLPGTSVTVAGVVTEYRPGASGLTITEITRPTVEVVATGLSLPEVTEVGGDGLQPPESVIDDDADGGPPINVETAGSFDQQGDGIDFWESLEGMRIGIDNARAVGPTSDFGEIPIVPEGAGPKSERGGIVAVAGDFNPERVILDNGLGTQLPAADVGDMFDGTTLGVLDYEFNNFHLMATALPTLTDGGITREAAVVGDHDELSVATFNVENLDPADPRSQFEDLASIVVDHLSAPDLVALEEVQDNDGATNSSVVAADQTLQKLVDAIATGGGPTYTWQQINPVEDAEGGEPGGNIRVAFLVRADSPLTFVERSPGSSTTDTDVIELGGQAALTHSPGRVSPADPAWASARVPLAGEFRFGDDTVFMIANHWSSKGGDEPLFGPRQPPTLLSAAKRIQQAEVVGDFVDEIFAVDPRAHVIVLGDLNDFPDSKAVQTLLARGETDLVDLPATLPVSQRYSYVFEGNSQVLDHIVISPSLVAKGYDYDIVHVNAEFHDQVSDHDPQLVDLKLGLIAVDASIRATPATVRYGRTTTIRGQLREGGGDAVAGAVVELQQRVGRSGPWLPTQQMTVTSAEGGFSFPVTPAHDTAYRVIFAGDRQHAQVTTGSVRVRVAPRVRLFVSDGTVSTGTTVSFTGIVSPSHAGQTVRLQRQRADDTWRLVATGALSGDSHYAYRWTPGRAGETDWRVVKRADDDHARGVSRVATTRVRS